MTVQAPVKSPLSRFVGTALSLFGAARDEGDRARVRLVARPPRRPATPIEQLLVDTLLAQGPLCRSALVSAVARALYHDELTHSGWLAALGFFSETVFAVEVSRTLDAAGGVLWELEPDAVTA